MSDKNGPYIRIRRVPDGAYIWELFAREGHVIASSNKFYTHADCEQDAKQHNVSFPGSDSNPPSSP